VIQKKNTPTIVFVKGLMKVGMKRMMYGSNKVEVGLIKCGFYSNCDVLKHLGKY